MKALRTVAAALIANQRGVNGALFNLCLRSTTMPAVPTKFTFTKITVRANGKCHPAVVDQNGCVTIQCSCPGSQNGSLAGHARKVSDGHDKVNCRK